MAYATVAFWPWRSGATWAARSILVHPGDVAQAAARAADEMRKGAAWAQPDLAHDSLCLLEMRLRDLTTMGVPLNGQAVATRSNVIVRSPTLLESTSVFAPAGGLRGPAYVADGEQVLRRVRDYTHIGDKNAGLEGHIAAVGDPTKTPFAIFGLPAATKLEPLLRCLKFSRFVAKSLDALIVDVTRTGRSELPDDWEGRFIAVLQALEHVPGRRPPVVVLSDDAFALRKAVRALRTVNAGLRPLRRAPLEVGAYLQEPGLFGLASVFPVDVAPIAFEADIKDAALATVRNDLLALGRNFRNAGQAVAADAVSRALAFVRRSASLPVGVREAREIADIIHDGDDEVDLSVRALFRPNMALGPLAAAADLVPEFGDEARRLIREIKTRVTAWDEETPISAKLASILKDNAWNSITTTLIIPDRRTADIYLSSDRALGVRCQILDVRGLTERLTSALPTRIVVVGTTPDVIRALLPAPVAPQRVLLLGDAAGIALLLAEIAPIGRIPGFAAIAERACAMSAALQHGGANERLDLAEAEFRVAAAIPEGEIDFTRSGEAYKGEILHFTTTRGHRLAYRPTSNVLEYSPGETRPFERTHARDIKQGDRILVLDASVREPIRRAIAGSRENLKQLGLYHSRIAAIRAVVVGTSDQEKARHVLAAMNTFDPAIGSHELQNVVRWLTADKASGEADGSRQPRAARDWPRFRTFMQAVGVDTHSADMYWRAAIVPARSYRVHEGYLFNQRVVQFILDPEGASVGAAAWKAMPGLWQLVLDALDEVAEISVTTGGGENVHG
ncbi:hypothetical protein [Prosthecomicrobium hirschii]|uniref:hypothetical protein n=1 Tax=Prosthecodimorpha hirschii TaxID=665126 RepID=UPI001FCDD8E7|nr:hypothetical protein [Prosthecomicrobium hirschii]